MISLEEILKLSKDATKKTTDTSQRIKVNKFNKANVTLIEKLGFSINRFEKIKEDDLGATGLYYGQYKDWIFPIHEVKGGPLIINEARNIRTGEKINYYCDLKFTETTEERYNTFIKIMKLGKEKYIEEYYDHYFKLPQVFKSYGHSIDVKKEKKDVSDCQLTFIVDEKYIINVFIDQEEKAVLNIEHNLDYYSVEEAKKIKNEPYEFTYNEEKDFTELVKCLEALEEERKGMCGYYEDGKYYNNKFITNLIHNTKNQLILERVTDMDIRKLEEKTDHYKGLEIYNHFVMNFENKSGKNEKYDIVFEFDKIKDEKHCILTIKSEINQLNKEYKNINECQLSGSFRTMYSKLRDFIWQIYEIHGIKLNN